MITLGHPLLDAYVELATARARWNTVLATAFDLKVFFSIVAKDPVDVVTADVLAFIKEQRRPRLGAKVAELTDLVDPPNGWPPGVRLIVRREPLHPGAQQSLFPSTNFRYWGHRTDQDGDPVDLDASMRAHAHVEDHIRRLKDSGLCRFPFTDLDANRAWLATVCFAADLVRWFQLLCLTGPLARRCLCPTSLVWRF